MEHVILIAKSIKSNTKENFARTCNRLQKEDRAFHKEVEYFIFTRNLDNSKKNTGPLSLTICRAMEHKFQAKASQSRKKNERKL